jgi:hypothetical protein
MQSDDDSITQQEPPRSTTPPIYVERVYEHVEEDPLSTPELDFEAYNYESSSFHIDIPKSSSADSLSASPVNGSSFGSTSSYLATSPTLLDTSRKRRGKRGKTPLGSEEEAWVANKPFVDELLASSSQQEEVQQYQPVTSDKLLIRAAKTRTIVYKDSSFYEGELKNENIKHGKGTMHYHNGDVYDGEFLNDLRHGSGTCKYSTNSTILACTGHWENDKPVEGKEAVIIFRNGDRYFGMVKADYSSVSTESFFSRAFQEVTSAPQVSDSSNILRLSTTPTVLPHIQKHGKGELHFHNGTKYFGNFGNNHMSGYGVMVYGSDNAVQERQYYGNSKDSLQEGYGVMVYKDGTIYEGEWKGGNKTGKGAMTLSNGDKIEGIWHSDAIKNATYKKGTISRASRCSKILLREKVHEMEKRVDINKLHFSHINYSSIPENELMSKNKYRDFFISYMSEIKAEQKRFARSSTNLFIQDRKKMISENSEPLSPMSRKSIQDAIQIYLDEALLSKYCTSHYQDELEFSSDDDQIDYDTANILFKISRDFVHLFNWRYHQSIIISTTEAKTHLPNALDDLYTFLNDFKHYVCEILGLDAVAIYGTNKLMYYIKNCIIRRIYGTLFSIYKLCYEEQDVMFKFKLLSLCKIDMHELGVKTDFIPDHENNQIFKRPYSDCIKKLRTLSTHCFTAHDKFDLLVETHQEIVNAIDYNVMSKQNNKRHSAMDIGADDVFPVYLYVFIRAQLPNIYSEYQFMYDFMDEQVKTTEASYRFTSFENAINFVQALDVNIRDDRGVLVPISQLENRLERSILDISVQIKRERKEMPRFLWMSSLFIVMGNYAATETSRHMQNVTTRKPTDRRLLLDGSHHHIQMLAKYFDYAKLILKSVGVDVVRYECQEEATNEEKEDEAELYKRQSVEWTNLPKARYSLKRKMLQVDPLSNPDSPSMLLPRVGSHEDMPINPVFELVFLQMYPSYVYFSLAKNVEKITDYVIHT